MAIYVNGIKVAGRGISGKSPYQIAVSEGYTGTEEEFNRSLKNIGDAAAGFDELSRQVDEAKGEIEDAVDAANVAVQQALTNINNAQVNINNTVSEATEVINTKVQVANNTINGLVIQAENDIDDKVQDALSQIPDSENLATKSYVDGKVTGMATQTWVTTQISNATASIVTDVWYAGSSSPDNGKSGDAATKARKLLWIDTSNGFLKYYNGTSWVAVPVAWG